MHALHVVQGYHPWRGGSQRFFQEISERLVAEGHQVTVLTTEAGELEHFWMPGRRTLGPAQEVVNGVRVHRFPVRRRLNRPLFFSLYRRLMAEISDLPLDTTALLRRLARFTPRLPEYEAFLAETDIPFDVVHGANITLDFMLAPALSWARKRGIPFIVTPFTHLGTAGQRRVRRYYTMRHQVEILRQADAVITQTPIESEGLAALGIPRERLFCTGAGIQPEEVTGGDGARFRARHGWEGPIVVYIGVLAYDKGTVHLVEAMRRIWAEGRPAHLVLAGQAMAPMRAYLARLPAERFPLLHYLGPIAEEDKRDLLAAGDILCLPSCTDSFGIVFLEAWANGMPVIGARAGGIPAVVDDGVNGLLVPFGDVEALARAIVRLLDDPALAREMGRRGREKVEQGMTWAHVYERVRRVYRQVCGL
ncbi:MAG: glycosyltransferase family 4 protein [Chloroflexia bacterium]